MFNNSDAEIEEKGEEEEKEKGEEEHEKGSEESDHDFTSTMSTVSTVVEDVNEEEGVVSVSDRSVEDEESDYSDGSSHSTSSLTKETSEGTDRTEESEGKGIGIERRRSRSRRGRRRSGKSSSSTTTATGDITGDITDEGEHGIDHKHANMYILEDTQTTTTTHSRSHSDLQTDEIPEVSMDGKDEDPTFTFPRSPMDTGNFQALASKLGKKLTPSSTMVTGSPLNDPSMLLELSSRLEKTSSLNPDSNPDTNPDSNPDSNSDSEQDRRFYELYYSDLHYPKYFVGLFSPKAFLTLVHSLYSSSSSIDTDDFLRTLLFLVPPYLTSWIRNMRAKKDESDEIVSEEREEKEEKGRSIADSRGIGEEMTDVDGHHISYPSLFSVGNVDLSEEVEEKEQSMDSLFKQMFTEEDM
ncbi:hypothetical protein ADUPG1_007937 [Aduncisulcus paluster]|uniref:Uncharacterized protein n=1 Tax=Aduncisulcus paluster TaxID=2918883 RepID=A0ABQ5KQ40_9EUKA|nr:hypothetical protein ADUPG1_007937 [Aduncisulcus paluster]